MIHCPAPHGLQGDEGIVDVTVPISTETHAGPSGLHADQERGGS